MVKEFSISTPGRVAFIDITKTVGSLVKESSVKNGICNIFIPHTTAAITINENADPSVREDIISELGKIAPERSSYKHYEGNSDAHIKTSVLGNSETLIIRGGSLVLGTWQGIYFCEFDGPRTRKFIVSIIKG